MAKIRKAKGRIDGNSGYTRVIGNEQLGQLLSKVQATVISNGSELERMIAKRSQLITDIDVFIEDVIHNRMANGVYVCLKKIIKQSKKYVKGVEAIEPDMLIFLVEDYRICKIIELKDGDAFDTKKSLSEKKHLESFSQIFGAKIPFSTDYFICSFNQNNKELIKVGFKNIFDDEHIMTGQELCQILKIDYSEIVNIRKEDAQDNLDYFIEQLVLIPEIKQAILSKL